MKGYRWERSEEGGFVIWRTVPTVPKIMADYVESLLFLYPSVDAAQQNDDFGGSGFLLGVEYEKRPALAHVYVVTNSHVINSARSKVVRFTGRRGEETHDLSGSRWVEANEDDVAVCSLGRSEWFSNVPMVRAASMLTEDELLAENELEGETVSWHSEHPRYGDDVFMASRLANKRLRDGSVPAVRFGSLASNRPVAVEHDLGFYQDSFLVEMRSISGHSGSPVSLHYDDDMLRSAPAHKAYPDLGPGIRLLGIDWGHLSGKDAQTDAWNAGIACVVPAWKITDLLRDRELMSERKKAERKSEKDAQIGSGEGAADSLPDDEFGRFTGLTRKLLSVPKAELDEKRAEKDQDGR